MTSIHIAHTAIRDCLSLYYITGLRLQVIARNPATAAYHAIMYSSPIKFNRPDFEIKILSSAIVAEAEHESYMYHNLPVAVATVSAFGNKYYVYELEVAETITPCRDGIILKTTAPQPVGAMHFHAFLASLEDESADAVSVSTLLGADIGGLTLTQCHEAIYALKERVNQDRFEVLSIFSIYMNPEILVNRVCPRPGSGCLFRGLFHIQPDDERDTACVHCRHTESRTTWSAADEQEFLDALDQALDAPTMHGFSALVQAEFIDHLHNLEFV